jgi:hypothetical protein
MADKKKNNSDSPGQTTSETTAAAHVIFNDPEQPQRPVTVENINKTVSQAVGKAFAEKEKEDMKKLKVRIKNPPAPPTTQNKPKPKIKIKPDQVPVTSVEEETQKPKMKIKLKQNKPESSKKMKIRMKPNAPGETEEKVNTPTGISINQLAEKLADNISDKEKPSKPRIRIKPDAPYWTDTEKTDQNKSLAAVVSKTVASKAAALEKKPETVEPVANPHREDIQALQTKVEKLEESAKVEKTSKPMTEEEKKQSRSDAADALKALGFKKSEFQELLDKVDHIEGTTEKIRMVLKLKDNPAAKIPQAEVPAALEVAKKETKEPIVAPVKTGTKEPEAPKATEVPKDPNAPEQLSLFKTPEVQATSPFAAVTVTPKPPTVPAPKNVQNSQSDQDKAEEDKKNAQELKDKLAQAERDKQIQKKLDEIEKAIFSKGLLDNISSLISGTLKSLFGTLLGPLLKPLISALPSLVGALAKSALLIGVGVAAYEGASYLLKKAGYTGETLGSLFSNQDAEEQKRENAWNKYGNRNAINSLNTKLQGTGYTAIGAGQYKDSKGNTVKKADLPPEVQRKLDANVAKVTNPAESVPAKLEAQAPKAASDTASQKLTDTPTAAPTQDAPVVHVHQDNRQITAPAPQPVNDGGALIQVRNTEPSASGIIANLFDHPVTYGAVYRM